MTRHFGSYTGGSSAVYRPQGERNARGFYPSFEIASEGELLAQWSTPEQRIYNASTQQCPDCKGWGYRVQRKGREVIRENCGCDTCLGLGKIPKVPSQSTSDSGKEAAA